MNDDKSKELAVVLMLLIIIGFGILLGLALCQFTPASWHPVAKRGNTITVKYEIGDKLIIDYGDSMKIITSKADTIISTTIENKMIVNHKEGK